MTKDAWTKKVNTILLDKYGLELGEWEFFVGPNENSLSTPKEFAEYVLGELEIDIE